jgi:cytochrome c biogenesis protein CcmG/thiol:disulfide interchange protein DsbE
VDVVHRQAQERASTRDLVTPVLDELGWDDVGARPRRSSRRRWLWLVLLVVVAAGVAAAGTVGFGRDPRVVQSVLLDKPAPPLVGATLDGGAFDLADHRAQLVVVNVWASWCTACKKEHPELEAAAQRLADSGVQFVGINTQDTVPAAQRFLEDMGGSSYPSVLDPDGRKSLDWGVFGVPETFFVDASGRVRVKAVGAVNEDFLLATAAGLLAEGS